jgi:hypothetical protein
MSNFEPDAGLFDDFERILERLARVFEHTDSARQWVNRNIEF